jgi:hypothetical protein
MAMLQTRQPQKQWRRASGTKTQWKMHFVFLAWSRSSERGWCPRSRLWSLAGTLLIIVGVPVIVLRGFAEAPDLLISSFQGSFNVIFAHRPSSPLSPTQRILEKPQLPAAQCYWPKANAYRFCDLNKMFGSLGYYEWLILCVNTLRTGDADLRF